MTENSRQTVPASLTRQEFLTPPGRRRAWRSLMIGDHGFLRKLYRNVHEISPGKMWRSYQPSPRDLEAWHKKGIRTVINLRGSKPSGHYFLEEEACDRLGMKLVTFRVFSREAPSREILHRAPGLFEEISYPAIMHCKSGADRAGLMSVLFLFFHEGYSLDMATEQLSIRYGHIRQGKTGIIDHVFRLYMSYAKEHHIPLSSREAFLDWADTVYDPDRAKREFRSTFPGNFLTETILRRE